jgi:hypothetical protein
LPTSQYIIDYEDFEMALSLVEVNRLHPHEEIQPKLLNQLVKALRKDKVLKHPIIVDRNSLTVLDGNHRTEALRQLGCTFVPTCMVDYMTPRIKVECWYRSIGMGNSRNKSNLLEVFWNFSKSKADVTENNPDLERTIALLTQEKAFLMDSNFASLEEIYKSLKMIESKVRDLGLKVYYDTEEDAMRKLREREAIAVIAAPPLSKDLILKTASGGERFPCKATRHIIPARPMGINFPLDSLKGRSLAKASVLFLDSLKQKRLRLLQAKSTMNGRRYDEPIFLFE